MIDILTESVGEKNFEWNRQEYYTPLIGNKIKGLVFEHRKM